MTTTTPARSPMIEVDSRSRLTLPGKTHRRYLMHEHEDGTVVLEPAVVLSELEARYLANPQLQAIVERSRANPARRRAVPKRS